MKAQKIIIYPMPGIEQPTPITGNMRLPTLLVLNYPMGLLFPLPNADILNYKSQLVLRTEKFN